MSIQSCEKQVSKPKWFTPYWIVIIVATVIIGVIPIILRSVSFEQGILLLSLVLIFEGAAYYGRVKPSIALNRVMYILLGFPIGFVLWLIPAYFLSRIYTQGTNEDIAIIASSIICIGIGMLIGDMIGKLRHYKGPEQYQP